VLWVGCLIGGVAIAASVIWTRRGMQLGSTPGERKMFVAGDDWLGGDAPVRLRMSRAVTIAAAPEAVWPWIAQLGRGAGWYSWDRLDNGGRASARHIISWIPEPRIGDAGAIGYIRHLEPGRELAWWTGDIRFLGVPARAVMSYRVTPAEGGSRLLLRVSAELSGATAWLVRLVFPPIDTIMAGRELRNVKRLVERFGARAEDGENPETGARDQYQHYHVIYASGQEAGEPGRDAARSSRRLAETDGAV